MSWAQTTSLLGCWSVAASALPLGDPPASDAEPDAAFVAAWEAFFRASRRMGGRSARAEPGELTLSQYYLLEPLAEGDALTVGALADSAAVSGPTATRMLAALERAGHVSRSASPSDRRVVLITLTESGARALVAKREGVELRRRRIAASLEPGDRRRATELLRRLATIMDETP